MGKEYNVYCDFGGWKIVNKVSTPQAVYDCISEIYNDESHFVVTVYDPETDIQDTYKLIDSEAKLMKFKNELDKEKKNKVKKRGAYRV